MNGKVYKHNGVTVEVSPITVSPLEEWNGRRRMYKLVDEFSYRQHFPGGWFCLKIPANYKTDLATLPVFTQIVLGNRDDYFVESIAHDWLCSNDFPRWMANSKMRDLMQVMGKPYWKRVLVFWGLFWFGYKSPFLRLVRKIFRK